MILYRAICHNKEIKLPSLGIHFSKSPEKAYPYGAHNALGKDRPPNYYLYICQVKACDIDPEKTKQANDIWPVEQEIVLRPGSEVEILQVIELTMKYQSIKQIHFLTFKTLT